MRFRFQATFLVIYLIFSIGIPIIFSTFEAIAIIILTQIILFLSGLLWYWTGGKLILLQNRITYLTPEESIDLQDYIQEIYGKIKLRSKIKIGLLDNALPNAFTVFLRPHKYIIVFSVGLFENLDNEEIQAVLTHEISHIKNKDIWIKSLFIIVRYIWFPFGPIIESFVSRNREFRADEMSAHITNKPLILASALIKMMKCYQENQKKEFCISNVSKSFLIISPSTKHYSNLIKKLYHRHPRIEERVKKLINLNSKISNP